MEAIKDIQVASCIFLIIVDRSCNRPVSPWLHVSPKVEESVQLANLSVHAAVGRRQQRVFCCIAASCAEPCMAAAEASSLEPCMEASSSPQPRPCTSLSPSWLWWSSALSSRRACSSAHPGARTSATPPSTGPAAAASTTHVSTEISPLALPSSTAKLSRPGLPVHCLDCQGLVLWLPALMHATLLLKQCLELG